MKNNLANILQLNALNFFGYFILNPGLVLPDVHVKSRVICSVAADSSNNDANKCVAVVFTVNWAN